MMRLSTMWKVDALTDAAGSNPVAEKILERWSYERGSVRFFRSSANFLYRFRNDDKDQFIRFVDNAERSRAAIEQEMHLLGWLAGAGVDVAAPVPSAQGNLIEAVETQWGRFHAVVFPALLGTQFEIEDLDTSGFQRWGAALGGLHAALERYPADATARPTWRDHLTQARELLANDSPAVNRELDEIASALDGLPQSRETYGLIHFDFELDNVIFRDDSVAIVDFDDCSHLWYAADIAFALADVFDEGADVDDERIQAFLRGYEVRRVVDPALRSHVPLFLRLQALIKHARIARSADLVVGPGHPDWLAGLSGKLHDRMSAYRTALDAGRI